MLLTIDPGADAGWALFDLSTKRLVQCGLRKMPTTWPKPIRRIVIERPHTAKTRARKKDIITLAVRAGELGGIWSYITGVVPEYIEPNRWKGSQTKDVSHRVTKSKLTLPETKLTLGFPASTAHNVLDAIGIGLYVVKR
jgi:hypothetical protein